MVNHAEKGRWSAPRERRRFGRFATRLPVTTRRDDLLGRGQANGHALCRLQLQDFSLGGLRAESPVPLKVNERLTLRVPGHSAGREVELTGRVIHCRRQDERYRVGIEFCQARGEAEASPYVQLPRLFSLAFDFSAESPSAKD